MVYLLFDGRATVLCRAIHLHRASGKPHGPARDLRDEDPSFRRIDVPGWSLVAWAHDHSRMSRYAYIDRDGVDLGEPAGYWARDPESICDWITERRGPISRQDVQVAMPGRLSGRPSCNRPLRPTLRLVRGIVAGAG